MTAVVCDSNVYISAIVFGGPPRDVVTLGERGGIELVVSRVLISEVEDVLSRKFEWEARRIQRICRPLWKTARLVEPVSVIKQCRDPKDNHVLALAVDGRVRYLVTGDKDLKVLHPFRGIHVVSPTQFLDKALIRR